MLEDFIINAINELINEKLKYLPFCYKIEGVITEIVDSNTYKVKIRNNIETLKSMNNDVYNVNDIVYILVFNNNYSDKKILCKK